MYDYELIQPSGEHLAARASQRLPIGTVDEHRAPGGSADDLNRLGPDQSAGAARAGAERLVGASRSMQNVRALVRQAAQLNHPDLQGFTVQLTGPAGSGKRTVARLLHDGSGRRDGPFIEIACSGASEAQLTALFLGYEAGAFMEAETARPGAFELATAGTVYLDEVADLPRMLQRKLREILDRGVTTRLGGEQAYRARASVVVATRRNLEEEVAAGRFEAELYHRIAVLRIGLPPLRLREHDVTVLAGHFLEELAVARGLPRPTLTADALQLLQRHSWPGNVSEMRAVLEHALLASGGPVIDRDELESAVSDPCSPRSVEDLLDVVFSHGTISLSEVERGLVRRAIGFAKGNQTRAAHLLGITRDQMRYRLKKLNSGIPAIA